MLIDADCWLNFTHEVYFTNYLDAPQEEDTILIENYAY